MRFVGLDRNFPYEDRELSELEWYWLLSDFDNTRDGFDRAMRSYSKTKYPVAMRLMVLGLITELEA